MKNVILLKEKVLHLNGLKEITRGIQNVCRDKGSVENYLEAKLNLENTLEEYRVATMSYLALKNQPLWLHYKRYPKALVKKHLLADAITESKKMLRTTQVAA